MLVSYKYIEEVFGSRQQAPTPAKPVQLTLVSDTLTAREIISERAKSHFQIVYGDVQFKADTRIDVAEKLKKEFAPGPKTEDQAVDAALNSFQRNKYFFFWNDEQVTSLDQRLQILGDNNARFIQLIPLKGG